MSLVLSATAAFLLGTPTHAAMSPKTQDPHRVVCVPLRDKRSRPTGAEACRTAAQWKDILQRHADLQAWPTAFVRPFQIGR